MKSSSMTRISRSSRIPSFWGGSVMIFIFLLFFIFACVEFADASHFQYGLFKWNRSKDNSTVYVDIEQAWRWWFWTTSNWGTVYDPAQGKNVRYQWNTSHLAQKYRTVGSINWVAAASGSLKQAKATSNNYLKVISGEVDATVKNLDSDVPKGEPEAWWFAISSQTIPTSLYTGVNRAYSAYYTVCCRISTLENDNRDKTSYHSGWFNPGQREFSLSATGYPREYIYYQVPLSSVYPSVRAVDRDDSFKVPNFSLTATSSSKLATQAPEKTLTVSSSGVVTFTPTYNPNGGTCRAKAGYCVYAVSFTIEDKTSLHRSAVELDFTFVSQKQCLPSDKTCNHPPVFSATSQTITTVSTVPQIYNFSVSDQDGDEIRIQQPILSEGLKFEQYFANTQKSLINARVTYDVEIDGPNGAILCFQASDIKNQPSVGAFCLTFNVIKPDYLFIVGTQRTFSPTQVTNFCMNSATCAWNSAVSVDSTLSPTRKPTIPTIPVSTIKPTHFNSWWTDGTAKLTTMTMIRYYNDAVDGSMTPPAVINPVYKNPTKRVYTYRRPFVSAMDPSQYFTYSMTTQFDLLKSQTDAARAMKFGVSGGELWVFINNKLIIEIKDQQNRITHESNEQLLANPPTRTLTVANLQTNFPTIFSEAGSQVESFTLDIFYTHRNLAHSGFHMEFGSSSQCSAISILRSGQYEDLVQNAITFDNPASPWVPSRWTYSSSLTSFGAGTSGALRLIGVGSTSTAASVWYSESMLKVLNGFEAVFDFTMTGTGSGLAFVIQSQSPTAKGSEGAGLGYHGINKAIAIEFDSLLDTSFDTVAYNKQHISGHVSPDTAPYAISAMENTSSWPEGVTPTILDNLPFTFNNGTKHNIRIEFSPTPFSYFLYVYVGVKNTFNQRPLYTAQFPREKLNNFFSNGAYVGFTSSNLASSSGTVDINKFKLTIVPPLAEASGPIDVPTAGFTATAGQPLAVTIQLRDACGADVIATGESNRFIARFSHVSSKTPYTEAQNAIYDILTPAIADLGQGQYRFTGIATRSGSYKLHFFYQEVGQTTGQGQPINHTPIVYGTTGKPTFLEETFISATVNPGVENSKKSFFTFSQLPKTLNNVDTGAPYFPTLSATGGVVCLIVTSDGETKLNTVAQVFTTLPTYNAARTEIDASEYFACISNAKSSAGVLDIILAVDPSAPTGNDEISAAWIATSSSAQIARKVDALARASLSWVSTDPAKPIRIDLESASPARSGIGSTRGSGMILPSRYNMIYQINQEGEFYLYLKDTYGNPIFEGAIFDVAVDYSPNQIAGIDTGYVPDSPFMILKFETKISNLYSLSVYSINQAREQIGSNGQLVVDAGDASYLTSKHQGLTIGGTVDVPMSFRINLYDAAENRVLSQTTFKVELSAIYIVPSDAPNIANAVFSLTNKEGILAKWDNVNQQYIIEYTPTWAGVYNAIIIINGASITDLTKEMVDSKSVAIVTVAGPCAQQSLIREIFSGQDQAHIPVGPYIAGQIILFNIQTKDKYGNDRYVPIQSNGVIRVRALQSGAALSQSDFKTLLDTNLSSLISAETPVTGEGYITATYIGSGQYQITLVWSKIAPAVTLETRLIIVSSSTEAIISRELQPAVLGQVQAIKTPASWQFAVNSGIVSQKSIFVLWCSTAPCTSAPFATASASANVQFAILPRDAYENHITPNAANLAAIQSTFNIQYESSSPVYNFATAFSIDSVSGAFYRGSIQSSIAGIYTIDPQFTQTGQQIIRIYEAITHSTFIMNADITNTPKVTPTVQWPDQLYQTQRGSGAYAGEYQTIGFTDLDQFSNYRLSPTLETKFAIYTHPSATENCIQSDSIISLQGCAIVTESGRPSYECPFAVHDATLTRVMIISTMNDAGTTPSCGLDSKDCPNVECSTSKAIKVVQSAQTDAFVFASATKTAAGAYNLIKTGLTGPLTADTDVGTFKAGEDIYLFAREQNNIIHTTENMRELRLLPTPGSSSKFVTIRATSEPCLASYGSTICPTVNTRVWVFKVNFQTVLEAANTKFVLYFSALSTSMGAYSYSLITQPGQFSPQKSTLNIEAGLASFLTTAGKVWSFRLNPVDLYGNAIPTLALFTGFNTLQTRLYDGSGVPLTGATITCTFTAAYVDCSIAGSYFTKAGLQGFYAAMVLGSTPAANAPSTPTVIVSGKITTLDVSHADSDLSKSKIHLIPTGIGDLATYPVPPIASTQFDVYFFAYDSYNNPILAPSSTDPLVSTSNKLSLKLKSGDIFYPTPLFVSGSTWTASSFFTRTNPSYVTSLTIDKPTRIGFAIAAIAGSQETAPLTIFVRSQSAEILSGPTTPPSSNGPGLYTYINSIIGSSTLTTDETALTIDSVFKYILKINDLSTGPYLYTLGSPILDDAAQVILDFTTKRKISNSDGTTVEASVNLPATVEPLTRSSNGLKYAVPGQFIVTAPASSLGAIGSYSLNILVNAASGSVQVASYTFKVAPGLPVMDNSEIIQVDSFQTGAPGTIQFYFRDRLFNRVNKNYMTNQQSYLATNTGTFSPITPASRGEVVGTLHNGYVDCTDIHEQHNIAALTYALPRLDAQDFSDFSMKIETAGTPGETDILYTVNIFPVPRGVYTFNMTLISDLDEKLPASFFGCSNLIPLSFTVSSGSPVALKSYYTINPVVGNWVERYSGYAGAAYKVIVNLLDRDGSQTTPADDEIAVFYTPSGASGTVITATNGLYFNPGDIINSNLDGSIQVENLSLIYGHSYFTFTFVPTRAASFSQFAIYLKEKVIVNGDTTYEWKRITGITPATPAGAAHPSTQTFRVNHGAPSSVVVTNPPSGNVIAGQAVQFQTTALDKYKNPITSNELSTISVIVSRDSSIFTDPIVDITGLRWTIPASNIITSNIGVSTIQFVPTWEGQYSVQIVLNSPDGTTYYASTSLPAANDPPLQVAHATCAGRSFETETPLNYMCASTGLCVAKYADCTVPTDQLVCPPGEIIQNDACVALTTVGTYVKCTSDGSYVTDIAKCPNPTVCPAGTVKCAATPSECRATQDDCSSPPACPPGQMICPNNLSCANSLQNCPTVPESVYEQCTVTFGTRGSVCSNGQCVQSLSDCPTPPSCAPGEVLCLTDGRCALDASHCYTLPSFQAPTPATCLSQYPVTGILCADGTCASKFANCPSQLTCPVGQVLCARDNTCKSSISLCPAAPTEGESTPILPDNTTIECSGSEFRCSTGACVQNLLLCPTQVTCPSNQPVLCADRSCKPSLAQCTRPPTCGIEFIQCPTTGQCVSTASQCPAPSTCPALTPIRCTSGACAANIDSCAAVADCPNALPYRCSTGDCRASLNDCPSAISCPTTRPIACPDLSCALSLDMCISSSSSTSAGSLCPSNAPLRCPNGSCSTNILMCASVVTCPLGSERCYDGHCRVSCETVPEPACASQFLITCPSSASGIACARTVAECPQGPTCPLTAPVRCIDSTCAISLSECPPLPTATPPAVKVPCPDGSWAETGTCSTPITCSGSTTIKCLDQTCKTSVSQCPLLAPCDFTSATPYRCSSGTCVTNPWDCSSADPAQCSTSTPIRCQTKDGVQCVAALSACISAEPDLDVDNVTDNETVYANPCPSGQIYCRDGSCADSAAFCPAKTCPSTFPVLCIDGSCAKSKLSCPDANGCPRGQLRCPGVGKCVDRMYECPAEQCTVQGLIACPDGTCKGSSSLCKSASGCSSTQTRCSDSSCVDDAGLCSSQANSNYINSCPPGASYKCGNGLCVGNAAQCVYNTAVGICKDSKAPVLCASGECRQSTELCPVIKPCATGTQRCGDGSCRSILSDALACPNYDMCSEFGEVRCKQSNFNVPILDGLCSAQGQCFSVNGCPVVDGFTQYRCPENGRCVNQSDKAVSCTFGQRLLNGCVADKPIKCWNGECAATTADCPATNNCPSVSPFRCANGNCVATASACSTTELTCESPKIICADGSCKDTISDCSTSFGCPISAPVRCQDGTCKAYPATMRSPRAGFSNEEINTLTCPPTVSCPSNYFLCEDLSCVLSKTSCPSVVWNCAQGEVRCPNSSCRPSYDKCGFEIKTNELGEPIDADGTVIDPTTDPSQIVWEPSSSAPTKCPTSSPLICSNGACVSDILQCDRNSDPSTTTITGSPTSSQPDATKPHQVLCFDGNYRDSYALCREASIKLNQEQTDADPETAPKCVDFCPDGICVRQGQTARNVCTGVPSCSAGQYRCGDGTCRTSCSEVTPVTCSNGLIADIDGQCRAFGATLQFRGCFNAPFNYQCPSRECATDANSCAVAANRHADNYARVLLDASQWSNRGSSSNAFKTTPRVGVTSLIHHIPNSVIAEFVQIKSVEKEQKADTNVADETKDTRSCRTNCVADQQLYRTSLVYSPLLSTQTYTVGPLATGFTIQLYSGLQVNSENDLNIYIEPVGPDTYFNASNKVTYSRVDDYGQTMTSAQTVLSPVFSCSVGDGIVEPFDIGLQLTSLIDRSKSPTPQPTDVCLARLRRYPTYNYAVWECIFNETQRTSGELQYGVRQSSSQPLRQAISYITQCYDEDLSTIIDTNAAPSPSPFELLDDTESVKIPAIYAFIHSPVATSQVYTQSENNWFKDNIIWLLFVIIGGVVLVFLLVFAIMRLSRYSKKTDKVKDEIHNTEKEIEEMEQYGEKRRDAEVGYVANPLAVSLEQQQVLADQTDEQKIARKRQLLEAQQADSIERQEVIGTLESDVDAQLAALEALRKKAGSRAPQ